MNNKTTEHNPGASDSTRLFNSYFPSLFKTPPVQRAACALHLKNTSRTNRNHPTHSFYISHSFELSPYFLGNHQFSQIIICEN